MSNAPLCTAFCTALCRGERRRVSIGEALVSNARLLALDEYSTGGLTPEQVAPLV